MASLVNARRDALIERLVDSVAARYDALLESIRHRRAARRTASELRQLTPAELEDIGLSSRDVDDIASGRRPVSLG